MKLEHIAINVNEPAQLAQWLAENLNMRIVVASDAAPYAHFLADEAGSMIELYHNTAAPVADYAAMSPFSLHFAFASEQIEEDRHRLIAAGATPVGEITTTPVGDQLAFLRTPWHEPLQLVQRNKPLL